MGKVLRFCYQGISVEVAFSEEESQGLREQIRNILTSSFQERIMAVNDENDNRAKMQYT